MTEHRQQVTQEDGFIEQAPAVIVRLLCSYIYKQFSCPTYILSLGSEGTRTIA